MTFGYENRQGDGLTERNKSGGGGSIAGALPPSTGPPPLAFQPPHPQLRCGSTGSGSRHQYLRNDGPHKAPAQSYQLSSQEDKDDSARNSRSSRESEHGRHYRRSSYSPTDMGMPPSSSSYARPPRDGERGNYDPYYDRQDDARHPAEALRVGDRGSTSCKGGMVGDGRGGRRSRPRGESDHDHPYHRDGPSPGKGYHHPRSDDFQPPPASTEPSHPHGYQDGWRDRDYAPSTSYVTPSPYRAGGRNSSSKRKGHHLHHPHPSAPPTPDGPQLISLQSSDDNSISAFLPPTGKRARVGASFSSESATLMKSYTPLSPIQSRSFSREDTFDSPRFATPRNNSEAYRIFHSWSSGNSPSGTHSPSDVRICYDTWQQSGGRGGEGQRRYSNNRSWEEKPPAHRDGRTREIHRDSAAMSNQEPNIGEYDHSTRHHHEATGRPRNNAVSSVHDKHSRHSNSSPSSSQRQRWPSPPVRDRPPQPLPPHVDRYETNNPYEKGPHHVSSRYRDRSSSRHYQHLPAEDRNGMYSDPTQQTPPHHHPSSHHMNPPPYGRSNGPPPSSTQDGSYWNGQIPSSQQPLPPPNQYNTGSMSQRRDDIEDRFKMPSQGEHSSPLTARLSAPTPPVTNGWGRYGNGNEYQSQMYEPRGSSGGPTSRPPPHGAWDHRPYDKNGHFRDNMYNVDGQSGESREAVDGYNYIGKGMPPFLNQQGAHGGHLRSVKVETGPDGASAMKTEDGILLLSLPEDRISLSETLCIVRENVEVFVANEADVKAPAPGRKRPVVKGQVGLRCIHCRSATQQSDRVKRAVCFPSSIKRIYRTVIDMKLDHFKACRFVPIELKLKLEELKATNARSTGTTMQYFVQAAKRMGMSDSAHGIRFKKDDVKNDSKDKNSENTDELSTSYPERAISNDDRISGEPTIKGKDLKTNDSNISRTHTFNSDGSPNQGPGVQSGVSFTLSMDLSISGDSTDSTSKAILGEGKNADKNTSENKKTSKKLKYHTGKVLLALPEYKTALSPLRCFLRENVYAFSATAEDIAVRTPTTFSVVFGQVGIGCIHCHSMAAKERSNRAVCFPFSIGRIYQSVADIQRFHLGECKMVPDSVRKKFQDLQSASSKGSKGLATRQYWVTSAKKLGLVDSSNGIRFARDPSIPVEKAISLDILAQVASDATTAAKPLVLPEDEPHIAEFLFVVMKQLQPCRFTEADRNKRRLKDVGCTGVECKHCAGQVDGRKFFWSSVNAVESNFVSVHTHMMECKMIPNEFKEKLAKLKALRKEQTARLKSGSQKAFFSRVWKRLHAGGNKVPSTTPPSSPLKSSADLTSSLTPRSHEPCKLPPVPLSPPVSTPLTPKKPLTLKQDSSPDSLTEQKDLFAPFPLVTETTASPSLMVSEVSSGQRHPFGTETILIKQDSMAVISAPQTPNLPIKAPPSTSASEKADQVKEEFPSTLEVEIITAAKGLDTPSSIEVHGETKISNEEEELTAADNDEEDTALTVDKREKGKDMNAVIDVNDSCTRMTV